MGNTHAQLFRPEWVNLITKRYGFNSIDDLYAGVGYGGITANKVVMRLREEWLNEIREKEKSENIQAAIEKSVKPEHEERNAIRAAML